LSIPLALELFWEAQRENMGSQEKTKIKVVLDFPNLWKKKKNNGRM
jgi:hypothetical protein